MKKKKQKQKKTKKKTWNKVNHLFTTPAAYNFPGLLLRGRGQGFPQLVSSNCRKTEEKYNQTKFLAVWFPAYLLYLPGNLKS